MMNKDWSQANDLADKMPAKLADMKEQFLIELTKNKGLPIGGGLWIPRSILNCGSCLHTRHGHFRAQSRECLKLPPRPSATKRTA